LPSFCDKPSRAVPLSACLLPRKNLQVLCGATRAGVGPDSKLYFLFFKRTATHAVRTVFMDNFNSRIAVGKYLVSPLTKRLDDGRFVASVSIRSGRGNGMHDRVMRFTPLFASSASAVRYATEQGLGWVRERVAPAITPAHIVSSF
jgi:hypothetical protein